LRRTVWNALKSADILSHQALFLKNTTMEQSSDKAYHIRGSWKWHRNWHGCGNNDRNNRKLKPRSKNLNSLTTKKSSDSSKDLKRALKLSVQEVDEITLASTMTSFLDESLRIINSYKVGYSEHLLVLDK